MIEPAGKTIAGHGLAIHEDDRLVFGYTESGFPAADLKRLFPHHGLLFLKQVHRQRIVSPDEWRPGIEADGLLLDRPKVVAVIQTADCLPLFFFDEKGRYGGVIHVGWRGLLQGIEQNLAMRLGSMMERTSFFIGPAIEKNCYEVGEELCDLFAGKPYAGGIFSFKRKGKYNLDLKAGLASSLAALGADPERIRDCGLCTYCSGGRFPSYRRDGKTGSRIFNFIALKGGGGGETLRLPST